MAPARPAYDLCVSTFAIDSNQSIAPKALVEPSSIAVMITISLFIVAAALAIPTYGISLPVFFLLKNAYDNRAVSAILTQAVKSMREGLTTQLHRVNRAAVRKLFFRYCVEGTQGGLEIDRSTFTWGVFSHPMINGGRKFSLRVIDTPRSPLSIQAVPGVDSQTLSDHLDGIGSASLAVMGILAKQEIRRKD